MSDTMDRGRFNTLRQEIEAVEVRIHMMASWETWSRDQQLAPQRGALEALLCGLEHIAANIRLGETAPVAPLTTQDLEWLAEKMAIVAAQGRRVWNQPQGRYTVAV